MPNLRDWRGGTIIRIFCKRPAQREQANAYNINRNENEIKR